MSSPFSESRDAELAALLAASPPRRVPDSIARAAREQAGARSTLGIGAILVLVGTVCMWVFFPWKIWQEIRLATGGTATSDGRIVEAKQTRMSTGKQLHQVFVWRYVFEFQPASPGVATRGECFTDGKHWQEGDRVIVRYNRERPQLACPEDARLNESEIGLMSGLLLLLPVAGVYTILYNASARWRAMRLLKRGRVGEAAVVAVERKSLPQGENSDPPPVWAKITLRTGVPGRENSHTVLSHLPEFIEFAEGRLASGQPVYILFNPARPRQVILPESLSW